MAHNDKDDRIGAHGYVKFKNNSVAIAIRSLKDRCVTIIVSLTQVLV